MAVDALHEFRIPTETEGVAVTSAQPSVLEQLATIYHNAIAGVLNEEQASPFAVLAKLRKNDGT